jgi:hypothetical protein
MRVRGPQSWSDTALDVLFYVVLIGTALISATAGCWSVGLF